MISQMVGMKEGKAILWSALLSILGVLSGNRSDPDLWVANNTYDVTHDEQNSKVIRRSELRDAHVYVLWMKPMILETRCTVRTAVSFVQVGPT